VKRHASLLGHPKDQVLWVGDDEDWGRMRADEKSALVCPHEGCCVRLVPVNHHRRFLRFAPGTGNECGHWSVGGGAAEESPRHLWLKARLTRIVRSLGYEAIPEHPQTRADVYVPKAALAIEVQLRGTKFEKRTEARRRAGASVLWLLPPQQSTTSRAVSRGVFNFPGARFLVVDRRDWSKELAPWDDPNCNADAWLVVFATVFRLCDEAPYLKSGRTDGKKFLNQVLGGELLWYPQTTSEWPRDGHRPPGGWARSADLAEANRRGRATLPQPAHEKVVTVTSTVVSPPPSTPGVGTKPIEEFIGAPVEANRGAGYTPRPKESRLVRVFHVVTVASLPVPVPFRGDGCMARPPRLTLRRRIGRAIRRSAPANCCWYHAGDWHPVCETAVNTVRQAYQGAPTLDVALERVNDARQSLSSDLWADEALNSLLSPAVSIEIDSESCYINGQHRSYVLLETGVSEVVTTSMVPVG